MSENEQLQLSPSRISDFQQCPQLYKFRAIDKLPEKPGLDALRGSLVHLVLEKLFHLNAQDRTFEKACDLLTPAWEDLLEEDINVLCALNPDLIFPITQKTDVDQDLLSKLFNESKDLLANYFGIEDPTKIEPNSLEELIEFDISEKTKLKGFVDRIDKSPQGWLRVNDYKTGKSPKENFSAKAMFQLKFYAVVIYKKTGVLPKLLRLIYLKDSQILTYEPDEQDIIQTLAKVSIIVESINNAKETKIWPTKVSKLCDYCYFKKICPEFS